jgi:hypothetical protein
VTNEDENDAQAPAGLELEGAGETRRYGQGPGRPPSKKTRILAWLTDRDWKEVSEDRALELAHTFPDCSDDTIRTALLESGLPLALLVEGVVQDNYQHVEASLAALLLEYEAAEASGNTPRVQLIRSVVVRAKVHAEFAANNPKVHQRKRKIKAEMALWMHTWLENPPLFGAWVEIRKRRTPGLMDEAQ